MKGASGGVWIAAALAVPTCLPAVDVQFRALPGQKIEGSVVATDYDRQPSRRVLGAHRAKATSWVFEDGVVLLVTDGNTREVADLRLEGRSRLWIDWPGKGYVFSNAWMPGARINFKIMGCSPAYLDLLVTSYASEAGGEPGFLHDGNVFRFDVENHHVTRFREYSTMPDGSESYVRVVDFGTRGSTCLGGTRSTYCDPMPLQTYADPIPMFDVVFEETSLSDFERGRDDLLGELTTGMTEVIRDAPGTIPGLKDAVLAQMAAADPVKRGLDRGYYDDGKFIPPYSMLSLPQKLKYQVGRYRLLLVMVAILGSVLLAILYIQKRGAEQA